MNKTAKLMAGISSAALALTMAGCSNTNADNGGWDAAQSDDIPPMPENTNCSEWDWDDDDGVWECDDRSSSYFGWYFFGGTFFGSKSALYRHKPYLDYQKSPSYRGTSGKNTTSTRRGSSGFGRGSISTGG